MIETRFDCNGHRAARIFEYTIDFGRTATIAAVISSREIRLQDRIHTRDFKSAFELIGLSVPIIHLPSPSTIYSPVPTANETEIRPYELIKIKKRKNSNNSGNNGLRFLRSERSFAINLAV